MALRKISYEELQEILRLHKMWLVNDHGGKAANLSNADLRGVYLWRANLSNADLQGVNFRHTNLSGANLSGANLSGANLSSTNLYCADLRGAKLSQSIPNCCWIQGSKWLRSDVPWWLGHKNQTKIVLYKGRR